MNILNREELIKARGNLTRPEVARELNITPQMLGAIERGDRTPSLILANKIAVFYNLSIECLFFEQKGNKVFHKVLCD